MKAQKRTTLFLMFAFIFMAITSVAQVDWSVNPNQYVYSMTITGKVIIEGNLSHNQDDMVAAFINGECRGVARVKYQSALDDYFVFLMLYSNDPTGTVTFKIYDANNNEILDAKIQIDFEVNAIIGSVSAPFLFAEDFQVFGANIVSFTIQDQKGTTYINNNQVLLIQKITGNLSNIAPVFQLSVGAKAFVNGVEQVSGITVNDFRRTINYTIVPESGSNKTYRVTIIKESVESSTEISLSNNTIMENTDSILIGILEVESNVLGYNYEFSLSDNAQSENEFFYIEGNKLMVKEQLNFEQQFQYTVNVKVDNNKGVSKDQIFVVDVIDANDSPRGLLLSTNVLSISTSVYRRVAIFIVDDEDENDTHKFAFKEGNNENDNSFFSINGDSLVLIKSLKDFEKTTLSIFAEVSDSSGATFKREWVFSIADMNFAPRFLSEPLNYAIQNQVYIYSVEVEDTEGDQLSVSFENIPEWLTYSSITNLLSGIPLNEHVGIHNFNVLVSDGFKTSLQQVIISVLNINDPPEINIFPALQIFFTNTENSVELQKNSIVDPDIDDELTFRISLENNSALPDWLSFNPETMVLSGNPSKDQIGLYNLKLVATDQGKLKEWVVFTLEVSVPTAFENTNNLVGFKVYPNPFVNKIYLDIPRGEEARIGIYTILGQKIKQVTLMQGLKKSINLKDILPGIYYLEIKQGEKRFINKIIKQ